MSISRSLRTREIRPSSKRFHPTVQRSSTPVQKLAPESPEPPLPRGGEHGPSPVRGDEYERNTSMPPAHKMRWGALRCSQLTVEFIAARQEPGADVSPFREPIPAWASICWGGFIKLPSFLRGNILSGTHWHLSTAFAFHFDARWETSCALQTVLNPSPLNPSALFTRAYETPRADARGIEVETWQKVT